MTWLTCTQVAPRVKLDASSVRRWCRKKAFPGAKKNHRGWIIPVRAVRTFNTRRRRCEAT
jgi:hypothetical protein